MIVTNKVCLITGPTNGIGLESAKMMLENGYDLIFGSRNAKLTEERVLEIKSDYPEANIHSYHLDLSSFQSVRDFAYHIKNDFNKIDIMINNAGIMIPPYELTEDGNESQFQVNHLGHFLLNNLLFHLITDRIIVVSSIASYKGEINFDDLNSKNNYRAFKAYRQSKYANLIYGLLLDDKLKTSNSVVKCIVAHPGITKTNLMSRGKSKKANYISDTIMKLFSQKTSAGAECIVYAALEPSLNGGECIGPSGHAQRKGTPSLDRTMIAKYDENDAEKLWEISEEITSEKFNI